MLLTCFFAFHMHAAAADLAVVSDLINCFPTVLASKEVLIPAGVIAGGTVCFYSVYNWSQNLRAQTTAAQEKQNLILKEAQAVAAQAQIVASQAQMAAVEAKDQDAVNKIRADAIAERIDAMQQQHEEQTRAVCRMLRQNLKTLKCSPKTQQ